MSDKPPLSRAAEPRFGTVLDPWNSVSTGHQRAEGRNPLGWRESRTLQVNGQLRAGSKGGGDGGGQLVAHVVGTRIDNRGARQPVLLPEEGPGKGKAPSSVMDMLRRPGTMRGEGLPGASSRQRGLSASHTKDTSGGSSNLSAEEKLAAQREAEDEARQGQQGSRHRKLFDGLVVYVNGSTHPLVSDHRLKQLLSENGARLALHLGRRQVTHVILGRPSSSPINCGGGGKGGAGGGLAGGKLEREIRRVRGCGIKYIGVEWALESIKARRRLPEAGFSNLDVAPSGQRSVLGAFSSSSS